MKRAAALLLAIALSGCGSIMNRGPRAVTIEADPAGAECTIAGEVFPAPARVNVSPRHNYTVSCRKEGYETAYMFVGSKFSGWTWLNAVSPWLFFGTIYDYKHDAAYFFDPGTVRMRLMPLSGQAVKR